MHFDQLLRVRGYVVCLLEPMYSFAYVFFRIQSTFETVSHRALFYLFAKIKTQWSMHISMVQFLRLPCISFMPGNNG